MLPADQDSRDGPGDDERVVVTGLGPITSIGIRTMGFLEGLLAGRSGAKPITGFDVTGYEHEIGCEVSDFDPTDWLQNVDPDELGRASQFSASAARMAVEDAGLALGLLREHHSLVAVGTTDGESRDLDHLVELDVKHGPEQMEARIASRVPASRLALAPARELGLSDVEVITIPTACAAGNYAVGYGYDTVRRGEAKFALCGGADAVCRKTFTGFYRLGTIAPDRCQPFDLNRKGILVGEGAGFLLLESLATARARGARIYAEILGYGLNCDADHQVAPNESSIARCMQLALDHAGVAPERVDLISAHGTGTKANDVTEVRAIRSVYGDQPPRTIGIKSMIGHTMGAASALGSIACALAITEGFVPPTINHVETDPDCNVDCVPNEAIKADVRIAQNNGLAFGGNNAVVLLGRCDDAAAGSPGYETERAA
jgi:3-oxoacyl-[acyl-carrier-protein] synthase II